MARVAPKSGMACSETDLVSLAQMRLSAFKSPIRTGQMVDMDMDMFLEGSDQT